MPTETATKPRPIPLYIENVVVSNDATEFHCMSLSAIAAICYEPGPRKGLHYISHYNTPLGADCARQEVLRQIENSGVNYVVHDVPD